MAKLMVILISVAMVATAYAGYTPSSHDVDLSNKVVSKLGEWLKKPKAERDRDCLPSKPNMGGKILPTQNANGNCTNNDGDYVEQICASMCYDCVCGDSKFNKTCFVICKFILSTNGTRSDICDNAVQTTGNNTAFDQCAAQAWTTRELSPNTDYACNQACNCCDLNTDPLVDCYAQCKNSAAFYTMGRICQAFSRIGLVGGTPASNLFAGLALLAQMVKIVLG